MRHTRFASLFLSVALFSCATAAAPGPKTEPVARTRTQKQPAPRADTPTPSAPEPGVATGRHGAVSAAEPLATAVGLRVLQNDGNAVDAAIAIGFTLAVTHPTAGNIGGGGFMVIRLADGTATTIDYRETAPAAATKDMYLDSANEVTRDSVIGPRAAGIPGTVAGFALAHARYGKLPLAQLLAPAVTLAKRGHTLDALHASSMARAVQRMKDEGLLESVPYYTRPDGSPLAEGDLWKQPQLAQTLALIAEGGADAFYRGPFAAALARRVRQMGGIWQTEDLANYQAKERPPLTFSYMSHGIITMPPPSAGGVVLRQILGASELLKMGSHPWRSAAAQHLYLEACRRAYADRNFLLGDPDFAPVPVAELTSETYIAKRMQQIDPQHATPSDEIHPGLPANVQRESHDTTHYSVVDRFGNAVANTYTLNTSFGSKVVVPGTGVLLNNEMDDFAAKPGEPNVYGLVQGQNNRIKPGKRMLSSMTPTIITQGASVRAVIGTPGGPTITTTVAQIIRALLDYQEPLQTAIKAPRLHHQWMPDRVFVEPSTEPALIEGLKALGHDVVISPFGPIGHANCIEVDPKTGILRAVADVTRGKGGAALAF